MTAQYRELIPEDGRQAFDDALGLSRTVVFPYVENHNFYIEHWYMTEFWRKMRELGALFVRFGFFGEVDDLFFLRRHRDRRRGRRPAVRLVLRRRAVRARPLAADRRRAPPDPRRAAGATRPPPALGPAPEAIVEPMTIMLWGITDEQVEKWLAARSSGGDHGSRASPDRPASPRDRPGSCMTPDELDELRDGEILVAPITAPSWTPVFARIRGAVSDIGGIMCHAAIVSREYGLPAVVGTGNATAAIRTGQRIRVDGNTGTVTILDD